MLAVVKMLVKELLIHGYNVVFDFLNHLEKQRQGIAEVATENGKDYLIIYMNPPIETILKRQANATEGLGRSSISVDVIKEIAAEFEVPTGDRVLVVPHDSGKAL
jgi:tRNA uridine 5-carbamoylmethylation protein Kti12